MCLTWQRERRARVQAVTGWGLTGSGMENDGRQQHHARTSERERHDTQGGQRRMPSASHRRNLPQFRYDSRITLTDCGLISLYG